MANNHKKLIEITEELNLEFYPQDWGIINSSGTRVSEFIDYYYENMNNQSRLGIDFYELIIASFNDALVENHVSKDLFHKFLYFIEFTSSKQKYEVIREYWKSIQDDEFDTYPVRDYL